MLDFGKQDHVFFFLISSKHESVLTFSCDSVFFAKLFGKLVTRIFSPSTFFDVFAISQLSTRLEMCRGGSKEIQMTVLEIPHPLDYMCHKT